MCHRSLSASSSSVANKYAPTITSAHGREYSPVNPLTAPPTAPTVPDTAASARGDGCAIFTDHSRRTLLYGFSRPSPLAARGQGWTTRRRRVIYRLGRRINCLAAPVPNAIKFSENEAPIFSMAAGRMLHVFLRSALESTHTLFFHYGSLR